jgi:hypothetical protein
MCCLDNKTDERRVFKVGVNSGMRVEFLVKTDNGYSKDAGSLVGLFYTCGRFERHFGLD